MTQKEATKILIQNGFDPDYLPDDMVFRFLYLCKKNRFKLIKAFLILFPDWLQINDKERGNLLNSAVESGNLDLVKYVVTLGAPLNLRDKSGDTPLHTAIHWKRREIAAYLIEQGVSLNNINRKGYSILLSAIRKNWADIVDSLLEQGVEILADDLLFVALDSRDTPQQSLQFLKKMLDHGANPDSVPSTWPILYTATKLGLPKVVELLLKAGATIDKTTEEGWTSIKHAQYYQQTAVLKVLKKYGATKVDISDLDILRAVKENKLAQVQQEIETGAPIEVKDAWGLTPFYYAASYRYYDIMQVLLEAGASPNVFNDRNSPLGFVVTDSNSSQATKKEWVQRLLKAGAKANETSHGSMAFFYALFKENYEIGDLLYQAGADINSINSSGETLLIKAVSKNSKELFDYLAEKGVHPDGNKGLGGDCKITPLLHAVSEGYVEMVKRLLAMGANTDFTDNIGYSALMLCVNSKKESAIQIAELLLRYGADLSIATASGATALDWATWNKSPILPLIQATYTWDKIDYNHLVTSMTMMQFNLWIESGQFRVVKNIIKAGFDINRITVQDTPPLVTAAKHHLYAIFCLLLEEGANPNLHGKSSGVLGVAVKLGATAMTLLIEKGAVVNEYIKGYTPLCLAAKDQSFEGVKLLLENGANPNLFKGGYSPLYRAVLGGGNLDIIRILLKYGANPNCKSYVDAETPLDAANKKGYTAVTELLANYVSVDIQDVNGRTPLFKACMKGDMRQINELLSKCASTDIVDVHGKSLKYYASLRQDVAERLGLEYQALEAQNIVNSLSPALQYMLMHHKYKKEVVIDINETDYRGDSLLHHAVVLGDETVVKALLEDGADPYLKNKCGETPVLLATSLGKNKVKDVFIQQKMQPINEKPMDAINRQVEIYNRIEAFEKVMKAGDLTIVNEMLDNFQVNIHHLRDTQNPLTLAIRLQDIGLIQLLLKKGAHIEVATSAYRTPLSLTLTHSHSSITQFLLDQGANPMAQNKHRILWQALSLDSFEVAEALIAAGAYLTEKDINYLTNNPLLLHQINFLNEVTSKYKNVRLMEVLKQL